MFVAVLSVSVLACLLVQHARSATDGAFAVKYPGQQSCRVFVETSESDKVRNAFFLGWLNGYLTGFNRYREETVDIAPWHGLSLLTGLLINYCQQNPDKTFQSAVDAMTAALFPLRLKTNSELVEIVSEGKTLKMYKVVVERVQQSLKELGYFSRDPDGEFSVSTRAALSAFQQDRGIHQSGLPDQETLYQLFR